MNTWPVLAAQHAVLASGLSAGALPVAGPIGGFAIGALLSGGCVYLLTGPHRGQRRILAAAVAAVAALRPRSWLRAGRRILPGHRVPPSAPQADSPDPRELASRTFGDPSREAIWSAPAKDQAQPDLPDLATPPAAPLPRRVPGRAYPGLDARQPESRPKPRHAAPASFTRRVSRLLTIRLLASGSHI